MAAPTAPPQLSSSLPSPGLFEFLLQATVATVQHLFIFSVLTCSILALPFLLTTSTTILVLLFLAFRWLRMLLSPYVLFALWLMRVMGHELEVDMIGVRHPITSRKRASSMPDVREHVSSANTTASIA